MGLSLKVLGKFEVRDRSGHPLSLRTRKTQALLAYLAINADKPQSRKRLMGLLWSDRDERQARASLNNALVSIRRLDHGEGLPHLDSDGHQVMIRGAALETDVARFKALQADEPVEAAKIYVGPLLEGLEYLDPAFDDWLTAARSELHTGVCDALLRAADRAAANDDTKEAIDAARRLVTLDPLRESGHRLLMRMLHVSGDRVGALRQYQTCAEILKQELQVEPDNATKALFEAIRRDAAPEERTDETLAVPVDPLPLDKPSIAVLPFENMSDDWNQEYFADGMAEDIITALSKFHGFFVIARNSSFAYRSSVVDVKKVARELGVRYLVEGSVRKGGERLRVTAQLIDAESGNHIWADRFDGHPDDIFDLQDKLTLSIVAAIAPEIGQAEIARARRKPPNSLDAWVLYQRGLALYTSGEEQLARTAMEFFDRAAQTEPEFADALAMGAHTRVRLAYFFNPDKRDQLLEEAARLLRIAMRSDPRNFTCYIASARLHYTLGEYELALEMAREAVKLNPNSAMAHGQLGIALFGANRYEEALQHKDMALRLDPNGAHVTGAFVARASALFMLGRYEECAESALKSSKGPNPRYWGDSLAVAALTKLGRTDVANEVKKELLKRKPDFSIAEIEKFYLSAHPPKLVKAYCNALRKAGLPE